MTQEDQQHTNAQVDEMLSSIVTHAKNVTRQASLMELVDNLSAADAPAKRRSTWPYWAVAATAACLAAVLVVRQDDSPQMAMNTVSPSTMIMHDEHTAATTYSLSETTYSAKAKFASEKTEGESIQEDNSQEQLSQSTATLPEKEEVYAYSETESGIRVYCENQCNAEEVIDRMEEMVKQSIVIL